MSWERSLEAQLKARANVPLLTPNLIMPPIIVKFIMLAVIPARKPVL